MPFTEQWTSDIWPAVQEQYTHVLAQRPAKQYIATGTHYGEQVYQGLAEKQEVRNVSCNLAFIDPTGNAMLQRGISFATVERFAIDMLIDPASVTRDGDQVAASAATDTSQVAEDGAVGRQAEQILRAKKQWRIPARVPRGYEIPIAITSKDAEPEMASSDAWGLTWPSMPHGWR